MLKQLAPALAMLSTFMLLICSFSTKRQSARIESIKANSDTIKEGKRLRIVRRVRGQPPPKVTWFKDDRSISKNRSKYQLVHLKRRSELIVKSALVSDSRQYECRAKNRVTKQPVRKIIRIEVLPKSQEYTGTKCPEIGDLFRLNGGTCVFFKDVAEPACKCPDGFWGNRCETKNPTGIHTSTYPSNQKRDDPGCGTNQYYGVFTGAIVKQRYTGLLYITHMCHQNLQQQFFGRFDLIQMSNG